MDDNQFFNKLLDAWELTYKKGQLSFWLLLSLKVAPRFLDEIQAFMAQHSDGSVQYDEQSLYRSLRKFSDLELVTFSLHENSRGPSLKRYELTPFGRQLLQRFVERNILPLYRPDLSSLIIS